MGSGFSSKAGSDGAKPHVLMVNCVAMGNGEHGVSIDGGIPATLINTIASNNGKDGIHIGVTEQEVRDLISTMPETNRGPWLAMLKDAVSGAGGGMTVEALKPLVVGALKAMGLTA